MATSSDAFMTSTDAFIWRIEQDPLMRWTISAVICLDGTPDWDALVARFDRLTRLAPRLRQHVVTPPLNAAPPRWTDDPYFDLSFHLRRVSAPEPGGLDAVVEMARTSAMGGLDRERPLWQATFVEHLAGGRSAIVMKMHHSLTDGIGGMQLAVLLADPLDGSEPAPVAEPEPARPMTAADLWLDIGRHHLAKATARAERVARNAVPTAKRLLQDPAGLVNDTVKLAGSLARTVRPFSDTKSPVMVDRGFSWHFDVLEVPFADLHDAAHAVGVSVNDAFVAAITGGLRMYHDKHGRSVDELRMSMPISIRTGDHGPGGNHVAIIRFPVPVSIADPAERMQRTHDAAKSAREEPSVPYTDAVLGLLVPVTPMAVGPMAKHMDFTASNVPGIPVRGKLCGIEVTRYYPFGPTGGAALNVTMLSYDGTCCIGVNCDAAAVPDPDVLKACLADGFAEVMALRP